MRHDNSQAGGAQGSGASTSFQDTRSGTNDPERSETRRTVGPVGVRNHTGSTSRQVPLLPQELFPAAMLQGLAEPGQSVDVLRIQQSLPLLSTGRLLRQPSATNCAASVVILLAHYQDSDSVCVMAWVVGKGETGQLGLGAHILQAESARPADLLKPYHLVAAAAGHGFVLLLSDDGRVISVGSNKAGQLGIGTRASVASPQPVAQLAGVRVRLLAAGASHALAVSHDGSVYAWGDNVLGQLGLPDQEVRANPERVPSLSNVVAVAAGESHSLFVTDNGDLYSAGYGTDGRLGNGQVAHHLTPRFVSSFLNIRIASVAAGLTHSIAVSRDGEAFAFGDGSAGQLGLGGTQQQLKPVRVPLDGPVEAVGAGWHFSVFLLRDGRVFATGLNNFGQLGVGDCVSVRSPKLVCQGIDAIAVGAHTCAARRAHDATWLVWGRIGAVLTRRSPSKLNDVFPNVPASVQPAFGMKIALFLQLQDAPGARLISVRDEAPSWSCELVDVTSAPRLASTSLAHETANARHVVMLFHPGAWRPESLALLHAFDSVAPALLDASCRVVAVAPCSKYAQLAWAQQESLTLRFPLLADVSHQISLSYGVDVGSTVALIISPSHSVRFVSSGIAAGAYDALAAEVLRVLQALQHTDQHGLTCPVGWQPGGPTIIPDAKKSHAYFHRHAGGSRASS